MAETAADSWKDLSSPWRLAFEEAWTSWCDGNLGIGAVLIDPVTEQTVSVGRNRVNETNGEPNVLRGNFMAHAEMNAFAAMRNYTASGLHLYTTLEPCLMCAASAVFLHVDRVHYAVADEFFDGVHDLWEHHPYTREWKPEREGPLSESLATFARALPLSVMAATSLDGRVMGRAHSLAPRIAALAVELSTDGTLERVKADAGTVVDALHELWPRLPA